MMKKWLFALSLLFIFEIQAFQKLDPRYQVSFGSQEATAQCVEYISFSCPHCIRLFTKEFASIEEKYIDTGALRLIFHPVPLDILTVQAMACMEKLNLKQKQIFLKALLSLPPTTSVETVTQMMKEGMEAAYLPLPHLESLEFLKTTAAFQAAFAFISQEETIEEVPSLEIDGRWVEGLPTLETIEKNLQRKGEEK